MTEDLLRFSDARSWALNVARLRLDLYRVVAAILASEGFDLHQLNYGHAAWPLEIEFPDSGALEGLAADFEAAEIEHRLVTVAAMTRVLLDQASPRLEDESLPCGTLNSMRQREASHPEPRILGWHR